ncbi:TatD family hydrolase [Segatella copri]|uniref:TatD family hydrolase n=1 Tax=Segatella copri TaxID=165179 RepID=UPI0012928CAB|nr:TatD family hydrolase [Segatella copri]MQM90955.1 TatD family deoxyribonuclease [Segatella copri]MQM96404.1 TatD family deoxyribonuclease [Segatella copri]MQN02612.1 TatD family deoxyribonuclease [Segatella copri]MQN15305.1 TatD family deoxyribonuclease [Segatella copri]MQN17787.1 TatD family deoxyribonuclease [Segatella copri]
MFKVIDTHTHFDAEEFDEDRAEAFARAEEAGVSKVFLPAIDVKTTLAVLALSKEYPGYAFPMIGLHPEEVKEDWKEQLAELRKILEEHRMIGNANPADESGNANPADESGNANPAGGSPQFSDLIAIGEVGLDYYWSREFENEQLEAFEEQVKWSVETQLPLMIHCRKAQNEMVHLLRKYEKELPGGVFHCFTGNQKEAEELLSFDKFVLGVGGVSTFKSSHLREDLPAVVPLDRIVLETDSPYMAPVPYRGKRNESAFVVEVMKTLAKAYGISEEEFARQTNLNAERVFPLSVSQV